MTEVDDPGAPALTPIADGYHFRWPCGIEATVDRLAERHGDLTGEIAIRSTRPPRPGLLHSARFNTGSTQARSTLARALAERDTDVDWSSILEDICFLTRERYREGEPSIDLRSYDRTQGSRTFVKPWMEYGGPTVLAAHGGSAKTRMAWGIAVTAATGVPLVGELNGKPGPMMFADYETDSDTADEILGAICAGAGIMERPAIYYRRMVASMPESAATLRREVVKLGVRGLIVDSLGPARGGDPNDAETTIRTFNAARSIGVPTLFTDHVTNAEALAGQPRKPFGSAYTWNLARMVWMMEKAQNDDENSISVALVNKKRNNGRQLSGVGYRLDFDNGPDDSLSAIRFTRCNPADVPGLAEKLPVRLRMIPLLKERGTLTVHELSEQLSVSIDTVKKTVQNNRRVFWKGPSGPDGIHRVALLATRSAE